MRVYLLLALILVAAEARPSFTRKRPGFKSFKKTKPPKGDGKVGLPHADLKKVEKDVHALEEGQEKKWHLLEEIHGVQEDFKELLWKAVETENSMTGQLTAVGKSLQTSFDTSNSVLKRQEKILDGQDNIRNAISASHQTTRRDIAKVESNIRKKIGQVSQNQFKILDKIKSGRDKALNSIGILLSDEAETRSRIQEFQNALEESADANAEGQAGIVEAISNLESTVEGELNEVRQGQGDIFKALDASQSTVENRIDAVGNGQTNILNQLKASRNDIQSDLSGLRAEQAKTQELALDTREAVQNEIAKVFKGDSATQHILDKCKDSKCDVSKVLDAIAHIKKLIKQIESNIEKDIAGVLSSESKTQSEVQSLEKNVINQLTTRAENTLRRLKALEKEVDAFLGKLESDLRDLGKDVEVVEKAQAAIEHLVKKILEQLKKISFPKPKFPFKH